MAFKLAFLGENKKMYEVQGTKYNVPRLRHAGKIPQKKDLG